MKIIKIKKQGIFGRWGYVNLHRMHKAASFYKWENYDIGQSFFDFPDDQYGKKPGITMTSFLFCKHGGFIYPITSGQEISLYGDFFPKWLSIEELLFVHNFDLTRQEMVIFSEIDEYFEEYPELWDENVVFTFEGLGDYSGPANSDHPQGQFGAIFVYYKKGEPVCMLRNCSTLPDHADSKTTEEGIYRAVHWPHNGFYPTLQLRDYTDEEKAQLTAYHYDKEFENIVRSDSAEGINLHAAGDLGGSDSDPWSTGCLTVSETEYYQFGIRAGFIADRKDGNAYDTYGAIKSLRFDESMRGEHWGYVVINRKYMDEEERNRIFAGNTIEIGEEIK